MIELIFTKIEEINRLIVFRKIMHQSFELSDNDDGRKMRKEQDQSQRYLYSFRFSVSASRYSDFFCMRILHVLLTVLSLGCKVFISKSSRMQCHEK